MEDTFVLNTKIAFQFSFERRAVAHFSIHIFTIRVSIFIANTLRMAQRLRFYIRIGILEA